MEREQLKGKQTPGAWVYGTSESQRKQTPVGLSAFFGIGLEIPGDTYLGPMGTSPIHEGVYMSLSGICREADAALIAEAGTVANETGMWPLDMVERIKELEGACKELLFWNEQPCHNEDDAAGLVGSVYAAMDSARAILNKRP